MEHANFHSNGENQNWLVRIGNRMQQCLAERHGETIEEFVEKHAEQFRHELDEHPEYIAKFERDSEETLHLLDTMLYH